MNVKKFKEVVKQIRHDYAVDSDENPHSVYTRVRARLEDDLYGGVGGVISVDSEIDDEVTDAAIELASRNNNVPQISESEVMLGEGSALPQVYAIAAAYPAKMVKIIRTLG
jgi:hypothetical protein